MHSAIGAEFKRVGKALWPGYWKTIARCWRKKGYKLYIVHDTETESFMDWKSIANAQLTMRKWVKIYLNKTSFLKEIDFKEVDCRKKVLRTLPGYLSLTYFPQSHPITDAKYKDPMSLFFMKPAALGCDYFNLYSSLPHGRE